MGHRTWKFELDGRSHKVELEYFFTMGKTLNVDNKIMPDSWEYFNKSDAAFLRYEWKYLFKIDKHPVKICVTHIADTDSSSPGAVSYDLYVDNHLIEPGKEFWIFYDFEGFLTVIAMILFVIILLNHWF